MFFASMFDSVEDLVEVCVLSFQSKYFDKK